MKYSLRSLMIVVTLICVVLGGRSNTYGGWQSTTNERPQDAKPARSVETLPILTLNYIF